LTNSIMAATVWMTSECLLLAKRYGIDLKTALAITNAGSGRSNASENLLPMRLLEGKWPLIFKLAHHDKDIRIAASIAHQQHASTPMLALTQQLFTAALNELGEGADYIEVAKVIARWNGTAWRCGVRGSCGRCQRAAAWLPHSTRMSYSSARHAKDHHHCDRFPHRDS